MSLLNLTKNEALLNHVLVSVIMGTYIFLWSTQVPKSMPKKIYRQLLSVKATICTPIKYNNQIL